MKKFLCSIALFSVYFTGAQNIEVVSDTLILPDAYENASSSALLEAYNPGTFPIEVTDIDLFGIYGNTPFSVGDTAFTVMPQDTHRFAVSFLPEHNILHNMALVIKTNSGFGHIAVELGGQGKFSDNYYASTENKSEEALKSALRTRLGQGYSSLGYTTARDYMYGTIDNSGGAVTCVYTGRSAVFNTRAGANANSFNCEHTFPQGMFNSNEPMRSDIHHLFPTDVTANSQRGNDPFGTVANPSWQQGGSKSGGGTFEPRDVHKGACARAMMYFVLRYQDYQNFFAGQEAILRGWHRQFPPTMQDVNRNGQIAALQNNRNPFVDYPQFEERITALVSNSVTPVRENIYFSDDTINVLQASGRYQYEFVIYNPGNQVINIDNFLLNDTSLHMVPGIPFVQTVAPGDAISVVISYNAANIYNADLQFRTDVAGYTQVTIPIRSGAVIGLNKSEELTDLEIYPNPTRGVVRIGIQESRITRVLVTDISGRTIMSGRDNKIDITAFPRGFYFIQVQMLNGEKVIKKIIRQ